MLMITSIFFAMGIGSEIRYDKPWEELVGVVGFDLGEEMDAVYVQILGLETVQADDAKHQNTLHAETKPCSTIVIMYVCGRHVESTKRDANK